jgi:hypothetical protein
VRIFYFIIYNKYFNYKMSEIESLLVEFTNNVANKIKKLQSDLDSVRAELKSTQDLSVAVENLNAKLEKIKTDLGSVSVPAAGPSQVTVPETASAPLPIPLVATESSGTAASATANDLTKLPAYKYAAAFKEIRRPINLNELYMMVLQSQHNINELQTNTDNILRRS